MLSVFGGVAVLMLCGCAPRRLKSDFVGFERAYADTSNRELLLNLARLEHRDPTYFFKIGQITSAYKMQASLTGTGSYALQSTNATIGGATGGGTPFGNYENDPIFTYIPVNDETNAQLLLKPVPAETFYILYQQGWRVDQLVRLMVDRIELTRGTQQSCTVETFRNTPPAVYMKADGTPDTEYRRDPETLSSYVTFLRISAVVYWLQKHGYLLLRGTESFVPYGTNQSGIDDNSPNAPKAQDIVSAAQKNAVWEHQGNKWLLGEKVFIPTFALYPLHSEGTKLVPDIAKIKAEMLNDREMQELKNGPALDAILKSLSEGFTVEGSTNHQDSCNAAPGTSGTSAHLIMRSLIGLMAASAQEQGPYKALSDADPVIPRSRFLDPDSTVAAPFRFSDLVPVIEREPLLQLVSDGEPETDALIRVSYGGTNYRIADKVSRAGTDNQYWNHDVFRLISQLTSQVTVDISKFPLTEILQ